MRRFLFALALLLFSLPAGAQTPPGCKSGFTLGFITCLDGSYTHADITSDATNTQPYNVGIWGAPTPGDVVGFNYSFTYNGTPYNLQFRHTIAAGETTMKPALDDIAAQFRAHPTVKAAIGADIVSYALVRQSGPTNWWFQFFQSWPFVDTGNPVASIYVTGTAAGGVSGGARVLEVNPYWACGRSTIAKGRQPMAGDNICGLYITGDVTGRALDQRNVDQVYGQVQDFIIDPAPGVARMKRAYMMDTVDFQVAHLLINGQPAGPIGQPGPPGGNVAGSIVQSPALTVCANQAQPGNNCKYTRVYKFAGLGITGWQTIATLTPSNVTGSWSMSKMKVEAVTNTHGVGTGTLESQAYIQIANGAPTGNYIGANTCLQSCAQFRFIVGPGNAVQVQIGSADGVHPIASGFAAIEYMLSDAEGTPVTWTIQ